MGVHENEFTLVTRVRPIRVNTEHQLTFAIIDSEAIISEEQTCFKNCEMLFFFIDKPIIHD
jgi:hypothetical protein